MIKLLIKIGVLNVQRCKNSIPVAREILTAPIVFNANFVII